MPTSIVLRVRPERAALIPAASGRAVHGLLMHLLSAADPQLAARLHDEQGPPPYAVSPLMDGGLMGAEGLSVNPQRPGWLRLSLLTHELEAIGARWSAAGLGVVTLHGVPFVVEALARTAEEHPWAGSASYEALAAPHLLRQGAPPHRFAFELLTPMSFKQAGKFVPLPLPDLLFGSLLERWNAHSPLALPEELRRFAAECLAVSRFELRSRVVETKDGGGRVGGVGSVTYSAVNRDRYWLACVGTLAAFARFAGAGAKTGQGLGMCRAIGEGR